MMGKFGYKKIFIHHFIGWGLFWAKRGEFSPLPQNYQYAFMDSDGIPILTEGHNKNHYRLKRVKCRNTSEIFDSALECSEIKNVTVNGIRGVCDGSYMSTGDNNLSFCYLNNEENEILYESHHKYDENSLRESKLSYGMFHTSVRFENAGPDDIITFKNKDELIKELNLKQNQVTHIDDVCRGDRKNVGEFRFFHIIDGEQKITDAHKNEPDKVIYRVKCLNDDKIFDTAADAARKYGLNGSQISSVCKGRISNTGGYHFENIDWLDRSIPKIQKTKMVKKYLLFPSGNSVNSINEICRETGLSNRRISKYLKDETVDIGDIIITKL